MRESSLSRFRRPHLSSSAILRAGGRAIPTYVPARWEASNTWAWRTDAYGARVSVTPRHPGSIITIVKPRSHKQNCSFNVTAGFQADIKW